MPLVGEATVTEKILSLTKDLHMAHYVKVGDKYYQPDADGIFYEVLRGGDECADPFVGACFRAQAMPRRWNSGSTRWVAARSGGACACPRRPGTTVSRTAS